MPYFYETPRSECENMLDYMRYTIIQERPGGRNPKNLGPGISLRSFRNAYERFNDDFEVISMNFAAVDTDHPHYLDGNRIIRYPDGSTEHTTITDGKIRIYEMLYDLSNRIHDYINHTTISHPVEREPPAKRRATGPRRN